MDANLTSSHCIGCTRIQARLLVLPLIYCFPLSTIVPKAQRSRRDTRYACSYDCAANLQGRVDALAIVYQSIEPNFPLIFLSGDLLNLLPMRKPVVGPPFKSDRYVR